MAELNVDDRVELLTGHKSGNYYVTNSRIVFGTITDKGKYFHTRKTWYMVKWDDFETPQRLPAASGVKPLNALDRLAEI